MTTVNVHEPGDYPIILGDSLKDEATSDSRFLHLRYSWQPEDGFSTKKGTLKRGPGGVRLAYQNETTPSDTYAYSGFTAPRSDFSRLALMYDRSRSAFVLEKISNSLDLNLKSAPNLTSEEISQQPQLKRTATANPSAQPTPKPASTSDDEREPDPSNPYDFRHFLGEARGIAEKSLPQNDGRTPLGGSGTPSNGISSPSGGHARVASGSSSFKPAFTSKALSKKPVITKTVAKRTTPVKRKETGGPSQPASSRVLSKERISDSDEELSDTITVKPRLPSPTMTTTSETKSAGHHVRNSSSVSLTQGHSPHIVVSNDGLEIDEGSPPPSPKRKHRIDPEAFRSGNNTPSLGRSSNRPARGKSHLHANDNDGDADGDTTMYDADDADADVDELDIGSPKDKERGGSRQHVSRQRSPPPPPPPSQPAAGQQEDDDLLAAELAAALDESEVSEEE